MDGKDISAWIDRIKKFPEAISAVMNVFSTFDMNAINCLIHSGPDKLQPTSHLGFDRNKSNILSILTKPEAYFVDPTRLNQDYLDEDLVRKIYSDSADIFESVADKNFPPVPRALVQEYLEVRECDRVLEIAVATGANLFTYPKCREIIGIDISERSVELARLKAENIGEHVIVKLANAQNLPFPDAYFDKIVVLCGLCVIRNPFLALSEIKRVLAPKGVFVLYEPSLSPIEELNIILYLLQPLGREIGAVWFSDFPPYTIPYNTYWDLTRMLAELGFKTIKEDFFDRPLCTLRIASCQITH